MASVKLKNLKANPDNPRTASEPKLAQLKKALHEFGDLGGFVYNRRTKQLVGGHQRAKVMPGDLNVNLTNVLKKPTRTGTVAEGFVMLDGERFSYREVDWTPAKEKAANIAANKGAGEWDYAALGDWMQELSGEEFDLDLTMFDEAERKGFFSEAWEDSGDAVEKEDAHVEGFRDTIKVKVPKSVKAEVLALLTKALTGSKYADACEISG